MDTFFFFWLPLTSFSREEFGGTEKGGRPAKRSELQEGRG